jgi:DnaJ like chaperone protein
MIFGKLLGVILGWLALGPLGALVGLIVGHFFDRGLAAVRDLDSPAARAAAEQAFFETVFTLMGRLAKADGRVSEVEIAHAEQLMTKLGLNVDHRRAAIELFKRGAAADFELEPQLAIFLQAVARQPLLKPLLLEYLIAAATADEVLHDAERELLVRVAGRLGFDRSQFERLLGMFNAQRQFHRRDAAQPAPADQLAAAYRALGVAPTVGERELKVAYRRLMGQHHPDRLIAQGVPEDMIKLATEKAQEIQAAYEQIRRARRG